MSSRTSASSDAFDLARLIERRIETTTAGRVRQLEVEVVDERVIIRGATSTYYVKQLALQGALQIIGAMPVARIELMIQVGEPLLSEMDA